MARLFADENFPQPVVEELRRRGHAVVTMMEVGKAGQGLTDDAVLTLAAADGRVVLTLNRKHFIRLHDSGRSHAGIVVCTVDLDFDGQAERIHAALTASPHGGLIRVNRPGTG